MRNRRRYTYIVLCL